jgi:hypothetical protein
LRFSVQTAGSGLGTTKPQTRSDKKTQMKTMEVINAHAAALDIGSEKIHGSVAGGAPRVFGGGLG